MKIRVGQGFDIHAFEEGRELWLGGVRIDHPRGLAGHSDADVLCHALCDALLGAAALGDLGTHFPDSDPKWQGAPGVRLLAAVRDLLAAEGWNMVNADLTLLGEEPKVAPYREEMQGCLEQALSAEPGSIGIKATTLEKLGTIGRGEGLAALAVALIESVEE